MIPLRWLSSASALAVALFTMGTIAGAPVASAFPAIAPMVEGPNAAAPNLSAQLQTVQWTDRRWRRRQSDTAPEPTYNDGAEPYVLDADGRIELYIGEQPTGRYGCVRPSTTVDLDRPCWARRALAPNIDK